MGRALSKSNILHSHKYENISAQYAHLNFEMYNMRLIIIKVNLGECRLGKLVGLQLEYVTDNSFSGCMTRDSLNHSSGEAG